MTGRSDPAEPVAVQGALIGIGALSTATGVSSETLRTWERRYGVPVAGRSDGGHRLYPATAIDHIRLIVEAQAQGIRASQATRLRISELRELTMKGGSSGRLLRLVPSVTSTVAPVTAATADTPAAVPHHPSGSSLEAMRRFDRLGFDARLMAELARRGTLNFMESFIRPLLFEIGEAWLRGEISEAHEHFASEAIRDALGELWRRTPASVDAPVALLSTLPGEHHDLGLHMAAVVCVQAGCRLVFLGRSTPVKSIARAARDSGASWVVVSVSSATQGGEARILLAQLRSELAHEVSLLAGGGEVLLLLVFS